MKKNWDRSMMRFVSARYHERTRMLDVAFENGDMFLVATESIIPAANGAPMQRKKADKSNHVASLVATDWKRLRIGETGDVLEIPIYDEVIEIPWDRIRAIADPAFRAHLSDWAETRARRLGGRIRKLRLAAGLSRTALAKKLGLRRVLIAHLETGKTEPLTEVLEQIALALGKSLSDFARA